ncbi:aldehyde dehydrogenase family protein [Streptomyces flavofungini]|uniref:Aldehyde dehydrogenase family protein n=1 Tax=Streptomyces flavofungini TaxID=68200 RepID=A0ABS0X874_9ACTN|nr:aldehyde dehydrogenase family protein [Streptomyces flavofungini]MBJ3809414.1 aldehyde dehydrogenase family protein [Streptomyces flavofungini]GHC78144.1 hypothetical protein GCM10010349_59280 [Streptomyces flavofungini]
MRTAENLFGGAWQATAGDALLNVVDPAVAVVPDFAIGLQRAARSRYGLAATVYTDDPEHRDAAARLPAGVVWINQWQGGSPEMVWEPAGDSGTGATGAHAAYDAATRPSAVIIAEGNAT